MSQYPEVVATIANDYLERLKSRLCLVPARERDEFLREIQSHIYEAYQQTPGEDGAARILAVLRKLGEPADVVSDRLPGAMLRSGVKRYLPLHVLVGILIALFGIPLGFGGVAVLAGILVTLAAIVATYYVTVGVFFLTGALFLFSGLTRIYRPELWDKLVALGFIQLDGRVAEFLDQMSPAGQGFLMIVFASVFIASAWGMLWLGKYLLRGLRLLFSLAFDWVRQWAQSARRSLHRDKGERPVVGNVSFAKQ
ncbi:MAG: DUF1700 domain-containing protein [Acidobacteriia bacterium]|nr:DUF1700 domain-containing protein [Terriglobia bacterium]